MWRQWQAYLKGSGECPFPYAAAVRDRWRVHWAWEAYRQDDEGKVERPVVQPDDSPAAREAHAAEGPKPAEPYTAWVETLDTLKARGYDLSARNPNQDDRVNLPPPTEITASLLERAREFQNILLNLHETLTNGEDS
ncbi:MAG: hypothetical protein D6698_17690 [Gammaproteobacteria bacterium]|nr:MAG: hypothetical protein D6698_17690 [Gammaproteobacteria bacterium]